MFYILIKLLYKGVYIYKSYIRFYIKIIQLHN